ncbi:MAG: hypothetical protein Q9182_004605 [Xanthomendoza sp. 2 TL-2023]
MATATILLDPGIRGRGAVAQVTIPEQVAIAISFTRQHHLEHVVRGGRHGTNSAPCTDGGIVLDLSKMNRVTVDPDNMTITAEVVVSGKTSTKPPGMTDSPPSTGLIRISLGPLRGAGARFGAVVEFTYRAHQQKEPVWAGMAVFSLDKIAPIVEFANDFALSANPDASFNFGFTTPPPAPGPMLVTLGFYNGLGKEGKRIFGLLEESAGHGGRKVTGGAACAIPLAPEFYEELKQCRLSLIEVVPSAKESLLVLELVHHGKVQEIDGSATAFANRGLY